nr:MAG TPA: hypothetical protein [Caudoviricetes sp.]DAX53437.1 MAG TPA: hypothetical protein [Caudoviricetes sp.]
MCDLPVHLIRFKYITLDTKRQEQKRGALSKTRKWGGLQAIRETKDFR